MYTYNYCTSANLTSTCNLTLDLSKKSSIPLETHPCYC